MKNINGWKNDDITILQMVAASKVNTADQADDSQLEDYERLYQDLREYEKFAKSLAAKLPGLKTEERRSLFDGLARELKGIIANNSAPLRKLKSTHRLF